MVKETFGFFIMKRAFPDRVSVLSLSWTSHSKPNCLYKEVSSFSFLRNKSKCRAFCLHVECFWTELLKSHLASLYFITSGLLKQFYLLCLVDRKLSTPLSFCDALSVGNRRVSASFLHCVNLYYTYILDLRSQYIIYADSSNIPYCKQWKHNSYIIFVACQHKMLIMFQRLKSGLTMNLS